MDFHVLRHAFARFCHITVAKLEDLLTNLLVKHRWAENGHRTKEIHPLAVL